MARHTDVERLPAAENDAHSRQQRANQAEMEEVLRHLACPKKGVWNFLALKTAAFLEAGEFQTPFFGQSSGILSMTRAAQPPLNAGAGRSAGRAHERRQDRSVATRSLVQ